MFKIFTEAEKSFWGAAKLSNLSNKSFTSLHVTNATRGTLEVLFLSHALSLSLQVLYLFVVVVHLL